MCVLPQRMGTVTPQSPVPEEEQANPFATLPGGQSMDEAECEAECEASLRPSGRGHFGTAQMEDPNLVYLPAGMSLKYKGTLLQG